MSGCHFVSRDGLAMVNIDLIRSRTLKKKKKKLELPEEENL